MICFNLTILTENCLVPIYKSLWINRVGLRGLDLSFILSWRSKTGSHWSRASCSHWWSKGRRLNILGLVRRILNSHWWSSELLWLFHNWWTILWNLSIHWIVHWWRLNGNWDNSQIFQLWPGSSTCRLISAAPNRQDLSQSLYQSHKLHAQINKLK